MGSIEIEFDYVPAVGDELSRAAHGIVLELALCAAQQSHAQLALTELQFGPALVLDVARRCRATCDSASGRIEVTSVGLAREAAAPITHLRARLGPVAPDAAPLRSHAELGAVRESTALAAAFSSAAPDAMALRWYERGLCAELASTRSDWSSYALHPVVATYASELASLFRSHGASAVAHAPRSARRLCVLAPAARVTRIRAVQSSAQADATMLVVAEADHGVAWYIDGLELTNDSAATCAGTLARRLLTLGEQQRRVQCVRALRERVAGLLGVAPAAVPENAPFKDLGLSSHAATELAAELAMELDCAVTPTLLFDHPSLAALADAVLSLLTGTRRAAPRKHGDPQPERSVAIIGMACRVPGSADTPEQLWELLCAKRDVVGPVPAERIALAPGMARHALPAGFLRGIELFDASFFGVSEREASAMDPQHRILLEVAWEALERAGIVPSTLIGSRTGVFVSAAPYGYGRLVGELDAFTALGNEPSAAAGRLSYFFGLRGPSMCVDAACASSLVSLCLACDSLRRGEIDLAIVGGVNLLLEPLVTESLLAAGVLSSTTRRCRTFDAGADGYVRSEACGVLVLRRGDDAVRAEEPVQALIRGYAVAHSGRSNGLGAPSRDVQLEVIERALADAAIAARDVGYVEAHGTGTVLGDAIELQAIRDTYGVGSGREHPVVVGSIKANIGHTELASGVISAIKAVLLAQHGELPPQQHFAQPTPAIDWTSARVAVAHERQAWLPELAQRIVSVNALGMSGTYAHLLLESAPEHATRRQSAVPAARESSAAPYLVPVAGCTDAALRAQAEAYAAYLHGGGDAARLATTSQRHRQRFAHRTAVIGGDPVQLRSALQALATGEFPPAAVGAERPKLAFLYSGFGTHYAGMGAALFAHCEVFRAAIEDCDRALAARLPCSLSDVMRRSVEAERWLQRAAISQPAIVALQHALTLLWRSWGVTPDLVIGHSLGELAAAQVAGVLTLDDALLLASERGRLMDGLAGGGAMAAVEAPRETVEVVIADFPGALWLAAANSPTQHVISGTIDAVQSACARFERAAMRTRRLQIPFAAHSGLLAPILSEFEQSAARVQYGVASLPLVSSMSGARFQPEMSSVRYFREQLRVPVEFARGMRTLIAEGVDAFVEVGPHSALIGPAAECVEGEDKTFVVSMVRDRDPLRQMLDAAVELYQGGVELEWARVPGVRAAHDPAVPAYAFQRRRYWLRGAATAPSVRDAGAGIPAEEQQARAEPHAERLLRFPESEAIARLERLLRAELRRIIDPPPADADFERTLAELGLSSLGAVQLRSCLQRWVGVPLPAAIVRGDKTVRVLANDAWGQRTRAA